MVIEMFVWLVKEEFTEGEILCNQGKSLLLLSELDEEFMVCGWMEGIE